MASFCGCIRESSLKILLYQDIEIISIAKHAESTKDFYYGLKLTKLQFFYFYKEQ